jgi:serine/threonine-protein kinase
MQTKIIANRYRTLKLVSEDSLGTLYKAVDHEQDQPVFLKLFNESIKQKSLETVLLFKSEITKLSQYRHPHVMNTYEIGEDKGGMYIVQEYGEGGFQLSSLIEHIDDIDTMVAIMLQVSSGLDSAHQQGILHRMVNPSSIILFKTDHKITAKVTDFGTGLLMDLKEMTS